MTDLQRELAGWAPYEDDRTRALLLVEASRRDATDWNYEDAQNVIAFLLDRLDAAPSTLTQLEQAA
jgi:hypothetical protein